MKNLLLFLIACVLICCKSQTAYEGEETAITNVSVLTMTDNKVLDNQTVIIRDGKIAKIGAAEPSKNATIIDGSGKYLMPGLAEMHAHIPVPEGDDNSLVKETLFLYLSQGVTTIRGMLGNPYHLELRKEVNNGTILGPRIYTSSTSMNGNTVSTPEAAREKVKGAKEAGFDFLKIHPGIPLDAWNELEKTAKEVGIPYAGHVPVEVGIHRALDAKYTTVDHLDGYVDGLIPKGTDFDKNAGGFFGYGFIDIIDEALIGPLVGKTKQQDVWIVPTQTLFTRWFGPSDAAKMANEPEMKYMSPKTIYAWRQSKTNMNSNENYSAEKWEKYIGVRKKILKNMFDQGVNLLLGSDAPQVFNVPGFSIHHELKAIEDAGIPTYGVLQSGTANVARFFDAEGDFGTIEKGAAADLILLDANPIDDIGNTRNIAGVMVRGKWLSKEKIDQELAAIAEGNKEG